MIGTFSNEEKITYPNFNFVIILTNLRLVCVQTNLKLCQ